jgi:subtilisin family serine protease
VRVREGDHVSDGKTTGRFIVSFEPGQAGTPDVLRDLHRFGGVRPGEMSLAPLSAQEKSTGALAEALGVGVVSLPPDALDKVQTSTVIKVRPERVFELPSPFRPKRAGKRPRGPQFGLAPQPDMIDVGDSNQALDAIGIVPAGQRTGKGVRVAILDTGIWAEHPDFKGRISQTKSFLDGDASTDDPIGHGTFCAGILAGPLKPQQGPRYGVAPDVELFVGRVVGIDDLAREFDVIEGIRWALDNQCRIISISVGAPPQDAPDADYDSIGQQAMARGCLIVAAAGNDSARPVKKPVRVPANSNKILAVAAATIRGFATSVSNAGVHPENGGAVDLSAPGDEIYSCCAPAAIPYAVEGGTSAAGAQQE